MSNREKWSLAWQKVGAIPRPDLFNVVLAHYAERHRHYHTLRHIEECLAVFSRAEHLAEHPGEIQLALWFHDVVYDTHAHDNEEKSAEMAVAWLLEGGADTPCADRVRDLILATKHDAAPVGIDAQLLVDVDLSILGSGPQRFQEYEKQVRAEYSWVEPEAFRAGRARILESFLERPAIYSTGWFRERIEARARENLRGSLEKLRAA